ncbi:TIGR03086 family protein, partial [cyanobacterium TDX16]
AAMQASGHYGPRVPVPSDASEQDQLLAFMGRRP